MPVKNVSGYYEMDFFSRGRAPFTESASLPIYLDKRTTQRETSLSCFPSTIRRGLEKVAGWSGYFIHTDGIESRDKVYSHQSKSDGARCALEFNEIPNASLKYARKNSIFQKNLPLTLCFKLPKKNLSSSPDHSQFPRKLILMQQINIACIRI